MGQTGSGKSTLLRLLCGLEAPDEGSVEVAGAITATKRGRRDVRRAVGYVMQHPERQLFAQTVESDVTFGPRNMGLPADEVARRVDHALDLVGLAAKKDLSPFELSGGQKRLAAIAGVLAMQPTLLVLDEPTASIRAAAPACVVCWPSCAPTASRSCRSRTRWRTPRAQTAWSCSTSRA